MKILVVDDHAVVRKGLKRILTDAFTNLIFREAGSAQEAIDLIWKERWDVVILDIKLPGRSGIEVLTESRKIRPGLPVLIFSMHPEDQFAIRMLKSGAAGYLMKETAPEVLVAAINKVLTGRRYISPSLSERMADYLEIDFQKPLHDQLSNREFQVMQLIASGQSVGEISEVLKLSAKTISTYRTRIMEKMSMHSNAELTRYVIDNQLIE
ncbi:MAG: response regulator transcription factor [Opitutales bacterium]|nr:response regulator transcription factor [Opitutales bacterium]